MNEDSSQVSGNTIHLLQAGRYNSLNYSERVVLRLSWIKGLLDYDIDLQASASHFTHLKKKILKHFYKFGTFFCVQTKKKTNNKKDSPLYSEYLKHLHQSSHILKSS